VGNKASQPGDVVFTSKGTVGRFAFVRADTPQFVYSPQLCFWRSVDKDLIDSRFLYYWMYGREFYVQFKGVAGQTDMAEYVSLTDQRRMHITLPDASEQRAVARILGTLDDKVELNRRMNETLESMARALFKSWFLDFDPVRAKVEHREAGLSAPIAALFPESFQTCEVGEIPTGWKIGVLDELTQFVLGGDWGTDTASEETSELAFCIRGADIPELQNGGFGKMPLRFLKKSSLERRQLRDGDLVIEISGGSPTQSTGRPVLISEALLSRRGYPLVCSNFCRLIRLKNRAASKFVYAWVRWLYDNNELLQFENGTTGIKNFAFTLFSSTFRMVIPPPEVLKAFDSVTSHFFHQQQARASESETLSALRDTLLPKLISGKLPIPDAERIVGAQL
jgi:type I restriction enzyme S subunit